ncbi:MAG: hypothetical protein JXB23_06560 [Candidatus Aminicenantes bacterium]|nr:hypothetical protein [Candidatus Aminicenantes bacterium]
MKKKKLLTFFLALAFVYSLWLGYHFIRFKTYRIDASSSPPRELVGTYHIHSTHSDGRKNVEAIARIAESESLDFIILTDHGKPNYDSLASQGWRGRVLVLAGSEISSNRGHLVVLGFDEPDRDFSSNAEEAAVQVRSLGGFSVIAHPYSKTPWTWGGPEGYGGIEIINADSILKKSILSSLPYWPGLLIEPKFFFCKIAAPPKKNLAKWDVLNANSTSAVYGYYSVDAHLFYRTLFASLRIHIPRRAALSKNFEAAKRTVFNALKRGFFYSAVDAAAQASGFRFWAEQEGRTIPMGGAAAAGVRVVLHAVSPPGIKHAFRIIHNGVTIHQSDEGSLSYEVTHPGDYRVEVYLRERTVLRSDVPWILSNPIFLKERTDG